MLERVIELDRELFLWLNFNGGELWDSFFWVISTNAIWIPLYLAIIWVIYRQLGLRGAVVAVAAFALTVASAQLLATLVKVLVVKPRPLYEPALEGMFQIVREIDGYSSTVSAHASVAFSTALFSTLLFRSRWYGVAIFIWAVVVSYSRIYLGAHYPLDLILGIINGLLIAWVGFRIYNRVVDRLSREPSGWLNR